MDIVSHIKPWHLPDTFVGYYVDSMGYANASSIAVYIPILMPNISFGSRSVTSSTLSKSCLCNDISCRPTFKGSVQTQNYIMLPRHDNNEFRCTYLRHGAELELDSLNGDDKTIHISNRRDPSFNLY